jgi:hypothetical protein
MTNYHRYEYDVALSFAKEDEPVARKLGELLSAKNIKVLYDEYETVQLGGATFVTHIAELYRTKAQYCLMLVSRNYPLQKWTSAERTSAQQHALRDSNEYILPIQLDDAGVPGMTEARGYYDLRQSSPESLADWLQGKLNEAQPQSGPPEESHDLRSGNVPSGE